MKKLFFFATAAVVLASCNNDVTISENTALVGSNAQKEIGFTALAHTPKRAAGAAEHNAVESTTYPQNYNMKVVAYSVPKTGTPGNYFGDAAANGGILFGYKYAGGAYDAGNDAYWGGEPAQYWPLAPVTLNFLAVSHTAPIDVVSPQFNATNFANDVTVTLSDNKPTGTTGDSLQHDLMYAFGRDSVTQTVNVLDFPDKVDMTFNHALAWVYFRVKAGNAASKAIAIKDIKLNGAYYGGTFKATLDNYDKGTSANPLAWNSGNTKWTEANSSASNVMSPNVKRDTLGTDPNFTHTKINTTSFTRIGAGILVVPTSEITPATESITSFDIIYSLNGNEYTYNYVPASKTFAKGMKYTYDITMTLHEILIDASVDNWGDGGTTSVNIP